MEIAGPGLLGHYVRTTLLGLDMQQSRKQYVNTEYRLIDCVTVRKEHNHTKTSVDFTYFRTSVGLSCARRMLRIRGESCHCCSRLRDRGVPTK